jgi:hypothetical protein
MKALVVIGLILVLAGALVLGYQGFTYFTHEKVVDAGPIQVTAEKEHFVYLPPILGGVALGAGALLMVLGARKSGPA